MVVAMMFRGTPIRITPGPEGVLMRMLFVR